MIAVHAPRRGEVPHRAPLSGGELSIRLCPVLLVRAVGRAMPHSRDAQPLSEQFAGRRRLGAENSVSLFVSTHSASVQHIVMRKPSGNWILALEEE